MKAIQFIHQHHTLCVVSSIQHTMRAICVLLVLLVAVACATHPDHAQKHEAKNKNSELHLTKQQRARANHLLEKFRDYSHRKQLRDPSYLQARDKCDGTTGGTTMPGTTGDTTPIPITNVPTTTTSAAPVATENPTTGGTQPPAPPVTTTAPAGTTASPAAGTTTAPGGSSALTTLAGGPTTIAAGVQAAKAHLARGKEHRQHAAKNHQAKSHHQAKNHHEAKSHHESKARHEAKSHHETRAHHENKQHKQVKEHPQQQHAKEDKQH